MILLLAAHILLLRQLDKQSGTFNKLQEPIITPWSKEKLIWLNGLPIASVLLTDAQ